MLKGEREAMEREGELREGMPIGLGARARGEKGRPARSSAAKGKEAVMLFGSGARAKEKKGLVA